MDYDSWNEKIWGLWYGLTDEYAGGKALEEFGSGHVMCSKESHASDSMIIQHQPPSSR